jgi:hypothetical protein
MLEWVVFTTQALFLLSDFVIYMLNHGAWIWLAMPILIRTDQHNYASECAKQSFLKKSNSPRVFGCKSCPKF